ncbi:MAG: DUF3568 family protein [Desulfobacterales bacterium]|jgi:hypothetical protein
MFKKRIVMPVLLITWLLTGCVALIVGAGVGAGTYTYVNGELTRSYQAKFDQTLQVCIDILNDLNQPILEKVTDGEKTTIKSERKDGTPQTIDVSILSMDWTQVSVRTGVVGYWKKDISQQFHEFIAERLKT